MWYKVPASRDSSWSPDAWCPPAPTILISQVWVWPGQWSFQGSPDDEGVAKSAGLGFNQMRRRLPQGSAPAGHCAESERGVSLPVPGTSPAIFLQCDLGCDYLCLVSPSIQKIVFDPFIFQKFFGSSGTIVVSFLGLWVIVLKIRFLSFPWGWCRKGWKACI